MQRSMVSMILGMTRKYFMVASQDIKEVLGNGSANAFEKVMGMDSGRNETTIMEIYKAFPHIKCTLYDLHHVTSNTHDHPNIEKVLDDPSSCMTGTMNTVSRF
ncbi:hypothetical protein C5167_018136 [Papaver somniferum]|uniref:Uncharacterized protein n=1 Tax=Papaver somniferum TaxID=3469 RepID=A0A4Y7ILD2_PAPSO|nr:hypothetical protein C5167_018138 [Papaver somniferum]RZC49694.1 hypothetical protein C5167_018137 [Papaver somniferum]RZC49696.1 hypothetical protein C5167_018136 [Papaver somniferum]